MSKTSSAQAFEVPQGASPPAPGEEIVAQVRISSRLILFIAACVFLLAALMPFLCLASKNPTSVGVAGVVGLGVAAVGVVLVLVWHRRRLGKRLTATTRRVVLEHLGMPHKTVEIEYSPTFSVTVDQDPNTTIDIGIVFQGGGRRFRVQRFRGMREFADTVGELREQAMARPAAAKPRPAAAPASTTILDVPASATVPGIEPALPHEEVTLLADEKLLGRYRAHWKANFVKAAGAVLIFFAGLLVIACRVVVEGPARTAGLVVGVALLLAAPVLVYANAHYNRHTLLTVTDRRVLFRGGWLAVREVELSVSPDLTVDWTRNVRYPVITIASPEGKIEMRGIVTPDEAISLVKSLGAPGAS